MADPGVGGVAGQVRLFQPRGSLRRFQVLEYDFGQGLLKRPCALAGGVRSPRAGQRLPRERPAPSAASGRHDVRGLRPDAAGDPPRLARWPTSPRRLHEAPTTPSCVASDSDGDAAACRPCATTGDDRRPAARPGRPVLAAVFLPDLSTPGLPLSLATTALARS